MERKSINTLDKETQQIDYLDDQGIGGRLILK
jgi:hypothetical protein